MMIQPKTNNHLSLIIWLEVLYICKDTFTDVMSALQIKLFMQNKAKFRKSQMNVNKVLTKDYENISNWTLCENKPNTKPIQSQLKPIKCQNKPKTNPIKPNFSLTQTPQTTSPNPQMRPPQFCILHFNL